MMSIFDKEIVFIVSGGRTGTKYFGILLDQIIDNSFSVHEPDVFSGFNRRLLSQIKDFGIYNMLLGRALRNTGIRNLSENYLSGKLSLAKLKTKIINHRENYYSRINQKLIIESYYGWYGCIPAIKELFPYYKIIVITRDPRSWVTSNMNWGQWYGRRDFATKLKLGRLNPKTVGDKKFCAQWNSFSRFEKLCWAYQFIYNKLLESTEGDPNSKLFRFEDLFYSPDKYKVLDDLVRFIVKEKNHNYSIPNRILDKKVHKNISYAFPDYENWDKNMQNQYWNICEKIHHKLGY